MSVTRPRPVIPEDLPKLLHSLSYAVIKNQPQDIISFAVEHFTLMYHEREREKVDAEKRKDELILHEKNKFTIRDEKTNELLYLDEYEGQLC
ncbi:hypothetical protein CDAR_609891 [Caerostris darwini]|uniref:RIIa domain-containing protein n=1 Tax=Caerostris darwini TaxID=1538125 RepID=A0AAV4NGJ3_9ARAC|nr:hypothetical protein CDAR_609891 [Caerostris darwini]